MPILEIVSFSDPLKSCKLGCRMHSLSSQRRRMLPDDSGTVKSPGSGQPGSDHAPLRGDRLTVSTMGRTQEQPFIWAVLIPGTAKRIPYAMLQKVRVAGTGPAHLFSFSFPLRGWYIPICTTPVHPRLSDFRSLTKLQQ